LQQSLLQTLGYQFRDPKLLQLALTHRSFGAEHNERLEYLGDAFLNFVIARAVYKRFPDVPEGDLSRLRASLVRGATLAQLAREMSLQQYLRMGTGERKTGGAERESNLANVVEAIIGAILVDGGDAAAETCILAWFAPRLDSQLASQPLKDPKTRLQEHLQSRGLGLPEYSVDEISGAEHQQQFRIRCAVAALKRETVGEGSSRKRAEQEAAAHMLEILGVSA